MFYGLKLYLFLFVAGVIATLIVVRIAQVGLLVNLGSLVVARS